MESASHSPHTTLMRPASLPTAAAAAHNKETRRRCGPMGVQFPQFSFRKVYLIPRVFSASDILQITGRLNLLS